MSDIFLSDEDITQSITPLVPVIPVEDSDGEPVDESILVVRKKNRNRAQVFLSDSDSDGEEQRYALSPRTRRSITGNFLVQPSEDEASSDIDYSDAEAKPRSFDISHKSETDNSRTITNQSHISDSEESSSEETSSATRSEKSFREVNNSNNKPDVAVFPRRNKSYGRTNDRLSNVADESSKKETSEELITLLTHKSRSEEPIEEGTSSFSKNRFTVESPENQSSANNQLHEPRYSTQFKPGLQAQLSSTVCEPTYVLEEAEQSTESRNSSGEVEVISVTNHAIETSSDDDISKKSPNLQDNIRAHEPSELIQSTIKKAYSDMPPPPLPPHLAKKTPKKSVINYISKEFYDKEISKLAELKQELIYAQKLTDKIGCNLPDGGRQLRMRCDQLSTDIAIKSKYASTLEIESVVQPKAPILEPLNWDDLSKAVNQVQPTHTGKTGLATFNTQKLLTIERLKELHGSLDSCPAETELANDPEGLKISLMPHQRHGLKWMMWREKQKPRGGILADDMGLGKTLSMIALVLAAKNRKDNSDSDEDDNADSESDEEDGTQAAGSNWHTKGRRTYYNGGTLVVCPASLLWQWEQEVSDRVLRNRLTVCVHHGNSRDTKAKHLRKYDIVVTTYNLVSREQKTEGALFGLKWARIILDEAHVIRNHKAKMSMAACVLRAKCRWILTGTPIHNKEMDMYALLKFLRCTPFNDLAHWKRWIDNKGAGGQERLNALMKTLMLRRTKPQLQERGELNCMPSKCTEVIEIVLDKEEMNVYQKVMIYSRALFAQFLFQRAERNSDLMYAVDAHRPSHMQTKDPNGAFYELHMKFRQMHQGSKEVKSTDILLLLLRLRQICCHPGLIDAMLEDEDAENSSPDSTSTQPEIDLFEQLNKLAIKDTANNDVEEHAMVKASVKIMQRSNPVFNLKRPSSKTAMVLEILRKNVLNTKDKAIIVSQWCSVLNIIKNHLAGENIATLLLDGSVNVQNRQEIVTQFNDKRNSTQILLLSLTAGGVGLNLVGGNHLVFVDLHWNPQLESQAQDRIYRVGQQKEIHIYKLMCKDTVEERIKAIQDKKLSMADGVLTGAKNSKGSKLTLEDLRGLFEV